MLVTKVIVLRKSLGGKLRVGSSPTLATNNFPGCSSVWSERTVWGGEVEGSNPSIPITYASVAQLDRATAF